MRTVVLFGCKSVQFVAVRWRWLLVWLFSVLAALLTGGCASIAGPETDLVTSDSASHSGRGEFGGDLELLRRVYFPPAAPGESNYLIDLYTGGAWKQFLATQGLTNNHTLFVLSHGKAIQTGLGSRYAYYPEEGVFHGHHRLLFSARDLATLLGPAAAGIRTICIAGCDAEGAFRPEELRRYFVHATTIIHAPPHRNGFEIAFRHVLMYDSQAIHFLYEVPDSFKPGQFDDRKAMQAKKVRPYVATLYAPGAQKPYKTETAGRELLTAGNPGETTVQAQAPQGLQPGGQGSFPAGTQQSAMDAPASGG